jgi:hypothetical protein
MRYASNVQSSFLNSNQKTEQSFFAGKDVATNKAFFEPAILRHQNEPNKTISNENIQRKSISIKPMQTKNNNIIQRLSNAQTQTEGAPFRGEGNEEGRGFDEGGGAMLGLCEILPDAQVLNILKSGFRLRYPLAYSHLQHYLYGHGRPYYENIVAFFRDNPSIATVVGRIIRRRGTPIGTETGRTTSTAPIKQSDYDNDNWKNSLGNIDQISWEILGEPDTSGYALVRFSLQDPYAWSPQDDRSTDCLHELLERQKRHGAQDYMSVGTGDYRLNVRDRSLASQAANNSY